MKNLHLICNAHIDPVWQWEWQEGAGAAISTFRVAADLCEKYDNFIFNHNEALLYQWIEEYEPILFKRIQALVKAGKWHIMGGWYLQPDCNLPSGESFIHQITAGLQYFSKKFGVRPTTAINFDPFGHTKGLVQILHKLGFDSYIFCRPGEENLKLPSNLFKWKGFNGSSVIAQRMPTYNSPLGNADKKIKEALINLSANETGIELWGVGNHGGGPSRIDLEKLTQLITETKEVKIKHSTPENYFAEIKESELSLPEVDVSLQHTMVGCYTSQIRIKQKHWKLENDLITAEKMASQASMQGLMEYPILEFELAWKHLMFTQFHDILPGSSIQIVEDSALGVIESGIQIVEKIKGKAFFAMTKGQEKAEKDWLPILVYNPHPYRQKHTIECEFMLADQNWNDEFSMPVLFQNGGELISQTEKEYSNLALDWRKRIVFEAQLEPFSMERFDVKVVVLPEKPKFADYIQNGNFHVNGKNYTAELNANTGFLDSYCVDGYEYITKETVKLLVIKDPIDPWGMTVDGFQEVIGCFKLADSKRAAEICGLNQDNLRPMRVIEDGDVRTVIEGIYEYENSQAVIRYFFPKNSSEIRINIRLICVTNNVMIKFALGTVFENCNVLGKTAFGLDDVRTDGNEAVACGYAVINDGEQALSIINGGTYGVSSEKGEMRLSLLRTAAYCAHPIKDRELLRNDRFTERIDIGERLFDFTLNASSLESRLENIESEYNCIAQKPYALCFFPESSGEKLIPLCKISNPAIILSSFFNDGDYALRLFNSTQKPQQAIIEIPILKVFETINLNAFEFETYEIKNKALNPIDFIAKKTKNEGGQTYEGRLCKSTF